LVKDGYATSDHFAEALYFLNDQILIFAILSTTLALFIWGRFRYDVIALLALLAVALAGLLPVEAVFSGFGHPAVITVAAILVISQALTNAGIADVISRWLGAAGNNPFVHLVLLIITVVIASAFMNNVGALALLIPVAVRLARQSNYAPSRLLMPLAFGSLLGGMTTLIGTPPNIIVSTFRAEALGQPYNFFDYTPVGIGIAVACSALIILGARWLLPERKTASSAEDLFQIEQYLLEVRVPEESKLAGQPLSAVSASGVDVLVVGLLRNKKRIAAPSSYETLRAGDLLLVETNSANLEKFLEATGVEVEANPELGQELLTSEDVSLHEVVVGTTSPLVGSTASELNIRWRYGVNLLAVARQGERIEERLGNVVFRPGDVLLLQIKGRSAAETIRSMGVLPLAQRQLRLGVPRRLVVTILIFAAAILATALQLLPVQVAFTAAAVIMVMTGLINLREAYNAVEWPIIVLLGAMIPVGLALEATGGAATIANLIVVLGDRLPLWGTLAVLLIITMTLSDIVNNAATAVLMAPIAVGVAQGIGGPVDAFLMAVAIGSSCAFLTPIGHQSNTLVMGPGGYHFGDYWKLGLPVQILLIIVAVPLLLIVWG
jgi:di/tricarboxylate transporter